MPQLSVLLYAVFKRIQFKIYLSKNMQCRPFQWEDKSEYVRTQSFTRYAFKQYINNYQLHSWAINAV